MLVVIILEFLSLGRGIYLIHEHLKLIDDVCLGVIEIIKKT